MNLMFRLATGSASGEAFNFHKENITEFIWARTLDQFRVLAEDWALFEALDGEKHIGVCYMDHGMELDNRTERWEFGGVYLDKNYRGLGIAALLARIAISMHLVFNATDDTTRVIAHVHECNPDPRHLLAKLGFTQNGIEIPPGEPPASMRRNANGKVVGDLFVFNRKTLAKFADYFERLHRNGMIVLRAKHSYFADIQIGAFRADWPIMNQALRSLAANA